MVRLVSADGLRGLLHLFMVVFHSVTEYFYFVRPNVSSFAFVVQGHRGAAVGLGAVALDGFSCLSGFVLYTVVEKAGAKPDWSFARFLLRRVMHVYPMLLLAVAIHW